MTTVRRNQGHSALNDVIRADWIKAIELSQDRFDALLYVPKPPEEQTLQSSNYEAGIFEELDSNQDTLEYYLPVLVSVLDCPDETESFMTMNDTDENLGDGEMPLVLRIGHTPIQIGSILEWEEELSDGQVRRCWWYVHSAVGYGTANVGSLYVCIPAANFEEPEAPPLDDLYVTFEKWSSGAIYMGFMEGSRGSIEPEQDNWKKTDTGFDNLDIFLLYPQPTYRVDFRSSEKNKWLEYDNINIEIIDPSDLSESGSFTLKNMPFTNISYSQEVSDDEQVKLFNEWVLGKVGIKLSVRITEGSSDV
ncbi:TPA: hypothetical protein ACX6QP_002189 [Photobacterium damselae]